MFNIDHILRAAAATFGALLLTTVTVGTTIAPAHAGSTSGAVFADARISAGANG